KEIQQKHSGEITITGLAPMAGPYNMSTVMKKIVTDDNAYTHLDFLSYMIFAYNSVYPLFDSPDEVFKQPYATTLPPLFDGEHSSDQIRASLPNNGVGKASDIFKEKLFTDLTNNQSEVSKALKDNDLYNTWIPNLDNFPMFMFHSSTDEAVPVENSRTAKDYYNAHNQDEEVEYIELPTGKHVQSYIPAYTLAYLWMSTLRE
ncbi:MAG: lipase family protein, partial [Thermotogota bacterium]